jgi:hypothetical protein
MDGHFRDLGMNMQNLMVLVSGCGYRLTMFTVGAIYD